MQTETIKQIKGYLNQVENSLKTFVTKEHEGEHFGPENEYTATSLKAEVKATLVDICALARASDEFVRLATRDERSQIANLLKELNNNLDQKNYSSVAINLDGLKFIVRQYNFRTSSESEEVLKDRINNIHSLREELEEKVEEIERIGVRAKKSEENIQSAESRYTTLDEVQGKLEEKSNQIDVLHQQAQNQNEQATQIAEAVKGHEGSVDTFLETVAEGQNQLANQAASTKEYVEALAEYENERKEKLEEAQALVNEAKSALEYTTAQGISAAYREKYIAARKGRYTLGWLAGSVAFVVLALGVGLGWVNIGDTNSTGDDMMLLIINRFTLVPLMVAGAWFCANQYVKNKNIAEDYSYKAVLAQSMVAFMDKLGDKNNPLFIRLLLNQVLQDPLRKTHAEVNFLKEENTDDESGRELQNAPSD